uniref:Uncharacterized protein n=1 Tax=Castor canadensis TaxID=51338 RepID=A0A8C0XJ46_CASCN
MSEQSKDMSDPNFAAEAPSSEVQSNPGVPVGVLSPASPAATPAGPPSPPVGLSAFPQAMPPHQDLSDEDPKALQQAVEESRAHQASCS